MIRRVTILQCDCDRCGYRWQAYKVPLQCSNCKTHEWNDGNRGGGWTYFAKSEDGPVKIGWTTKPALRLRRLKCEKGKRLTVLAMIPAESQSAETAFHRHFRTKHVRNEWFMITAEDIEAAKVLELVPVGSFYRKPVPTPIVTCKCHVPKLSKRMT